MIGTLAVIVRVASDGGTFAGLTTLPVEVIVHFAFAVSYVPPHVTEPVEYGDVRVASSAGFAGSLVGWLERTARASCSPASASWNDAPLALL
jgi:hypothetical protein